MSKTKDTPKSVKVGSGALFRDQVEAGSNRPTMTGPIEIEGVKYRLAGWPAKAKDGSKYLSLQVTKMTPTGGDADDDPFGE